MAHLIAELTVFFMLVFLLFVYFKYFVLHWKCGDLGINVCTEISEGEVDPFISVGCLWEPWASPLNPFICWYSVPELRVYTSHVTAIPSRSLWKEARVSFCRRSACWEGVWGRAGVAVT